MRDDQTSRDVLIPSPRILISVDSDLGTEELDDIGTSGFGQEKSLSEITSSQVHHVELLQHLQVVSKSSQEKPKQKK